MKTAITILFTLLFCVNLFSQNIPLPTDLTQGHPRLLTNNSEKERIKDLIENEAWANNVMKGILDRINPYVEKTNSQPDCFIRA